MSNLTGTLSSTKVVLYAETAANVFTLIGGQISHNLSKKVKLIDITNKSLGGSRIILSGAGARDNDLTGEMLFSSDAAYQFILSAFETRSFINILVKEGNAPLIPANKIVMIVESIGATAGLNSSFTTSLSLKGVDISVAADPPVNIPPTANFTFISDALDVDFTDTSTDPDGFITNWLWDFDDGGATSTLQNPSHTFSGVGTFNVSLTVTDNGGLQDTIVIPVTTTAGNIPPVADFTHVTSGLEVTFTDTSTDSDGTVTGWLWDFGD